MVVEFRYVFKLNVKKKYLRGVGRDLGNHRKAKVWYADFHLETVFCLNYRPGRQCILAIAQFS